MPSNVHKAFDTEYIKSLVKNSKYEDGKISFRSEGGEKQMQPPMKHWLSKYISKLGINSGKAKLCKLLKIIIIRMHLEENYIKVR